MSWFGRLFDGIRGERGRAWAGSAEDLLYDGETITQRVDLGGDDRVVVTSHRLLAFTPDDSGRNYRDVDLPNVTDVGVGHEGERNLLWTGGRILLYGAVLLAVGTFVDFGSFVPTNAFGQTGAGGRLGMGGLLAMLQQFLDLIARVDEFARLIGSALVLFGVFVLGVYLVTRDRVLVVGVAGDDDPIRVPADDDALDAAVADLEVVLFGSGATTGSTTGEPPTAESGVGAESDPLSPESGAVQSERYVADEQPAAEGVTQPDGASARNPEEDVERAVRETSQTDFADTVDRVVEGASDDKGSDSGDDFGDADGGAPENTDDGAPGNTDDDASEVVDDDRDGASDPGFEFGG